MLKLGWYFYILLFSLKCCGDEPFLVSHSSEILKSLPNKLSAQHLFVMCLKNDKSKLEKLFSDWSNKQKTRLRLRPLQIHCKCCQVKTPLYPDVDLYGLD